MPKVEIPLLDCFPAGSGLSAIATTELSRYAPLEATAQQVLYGYFSGLSRVDGLPSWLTNALIGTVLIN